MNKNRSSNKSGAVTVILLSFLLFYFPSVVNLFSYHKGPPGRDIVNLLLSTVYTLIFCLNYFLIIPKSLFGNGKKYWFYGWNVIFVIAGLLIIPIWLEIRGNVDPHYPPRNGAKFILDSLVFSIRDGVMMILSIALAYALQFSRERDRLKNRELELNAERRQIELRSLKMQLNPHFLFNSLNNIYALIGISSERAQEAVHDLSGMLRYMIYDAAASGVPLQKEMEFIEDYVRLMKLRISPATTLTCKVSHENTNGLHIAPLIFMTLVENAFKHFKPFEGKSFISISIGVMNDKVVCEVINSYDVMAVEVDKENSGVGIKNIHRQLDLLYHGHSSLSLEKENGAFKALLTIDNIALCK